MAKMITLSFKDNEMDLYNYVKSKSSPSIYMKDLIEKDIDGVVVESKADKENNSANSNVTTKPNNMNLSALKGIGR